jgi:hypothetical protein
MTWDSRSSILREAGLAELGLPGGALLSAPFGCLEEGEQIGKLLFA